jgi:hypothetical protein
MNPNRTILGALKLLIIGLLLALQAPFTRRFATANTEASTGTHIVLNRLADAAHSYTHLLVKVGSDSDHVAVCGAANFPIGTTTDAPEAAEDTINVHPLGVNLSTRKVRVATAVAAGADLYTAANGFAQAEPAVVGTYYKIGRALKVALQVGSGDYLIEFVPCAPVKTVVIAALTSTDGTAGAAADLTALKAEAEKIGDDLRAIAAALATPALVKVLT